MTATGSRASAYRGRFAPSPTGPLHFGSLVAAVASYLQAHAAQGEWLVRIDDIDPTREVAGAGDAILRSLDTHGFEFDKPLYQSARLKHYDDIIAGLVADGLAYHCSCSRKELRAQAPMGAAGPIYPGTCRSGADTCRRPATSVRLRTDNQRVEFEDRFQGRQSCHPEAEIGDFLIRRGDGLVAYQLAVVVDDADQGISEVVRGTDLMDATFMQLCLQTALGYAHPVYAHFPVALGPDGRKLSKQTGAPEIDDRQAADNLYRALDFLKQNPEEGLKRMSIKEIWSWATEQWNPAPLRGALHFAMGV